MSVEVHLNTQVLQKYSVASLAIGLAILVRLGLNPVLQHHSPFVTFYIAVLFIAWHGGMIPTFFSMGVSSLAAAYFFIPPINSFWVEGTENQVSWLLFFAVGFTTVALSEAQKKAHSKAEVHAHQITQLNTLLSEEKERLRVTLSSIGDAVIATDKVGHITFINRVAQQLTGWQAAEAIGQPLERVFQIVHEETRQPVESPVYKVIQTGTPGQLPDHTVLISPQHPQAIPIQDSAAPIYQGNEIIGVVLVFQDVSEQKEAHAIRDKHLAEIATLQERQRVARNLHDAVTQILFSSSTIAEALPALILKKPEKLASNLDLIRRLNRGALAQLRIILRELSYDTLAEFRTSELLTELADAAMAKTSVQIKVETHEEKPLPTHVHVIFYQIAQEALNNIVKHSRAKEAFIRFTSTSVEVMLSIEDKGQGFDFTEVTSAHTGVQTMRQCAADIGASFEINRLSPQGTQVKVRLPS